MTSFTIATFNVKNLIGADREYYRFERYSGEEHAWKQDWLSDQLLQIDADIVGFQEIFEAEALAETVALANEKGAELNALSQPDPRARYSRKMIFRKLKFDAYDEAGLRHFPNSHDAGEPGRRRPGLGLLTRLPLAGEPEAIQDLGADPVEMRFPQLGGGEAGAYRLTSMSRPVMRARIDIGGRAVTVFNLHLKSKLGEHEDGEAGEAAEDLLRYDPVARAMGAARAAMRRMAEAVAVRRLVVAELATGAPVIVLGDFNDSENAVSSEIISGERPFRNYSWVRRHDARHASDRYSRDEDARIQEAISAVRLHSAEKLFIRKSLRDMLYTTSFDGVFESIDQILLSRHFHPDWAGREFDLDYLQVFNDHLTDGSHLEAPYNKLASDHGQLVATIRRL